MVINIQYLADIEPIEQKDYGDWIFLKCDDDIDVHKDEIKKISLGCVISNPTGWECVISPLQNIIDDLGVIVLNTPIIVDRYYLQSNKELFIYIKAIRDTHINKGMALCMMRFIKYQPGIKFSEQAILCEEG